MPPNTQINLIKGSHKTWQNRYFEEQVKDCKDGSGLHLIFGQDVQKSKLQFWWIFQPLLVIFFLLVDISSLVPLLAFSLPIARQKRAITAGHFYRLWYFRRDSVPLNLTSRAKHPCQSLPMRRTGNAWQFITREKEKYLWYIETSFSG